MSDATELVFVQGVAGDMPAVARDVREELLAAEEQRARLGLPPRNRGEEEGDDEGGEVEFVEHEARREGDLTMKTVMKEPVKYFEHKDADEQRAATRRAEVAFHDEQVLADRAERARAEREVTVEQAVSALKRAGWTFDLRGKSLSRPRAEGK